MRTLASMSDSRPNSPATATYQPIPGAYDELLDSLGNPREKYQFLLNSYEEIGREEMAARRKELARLLKENGVTYNIYGQGAENERLWSLDLMPFLMESSEFSSQFSLTVKLGTYSSQYFVDTVSFQYFSSSV